MHANEILNDVRADAYPAMKFYLYDDGSFPCFDTLPLVLFIQKLAVSGRLKHFSLECVYEMRVQERPRFRQNMRLGWEESTGTVLLPQLRAALPQGEVFVKVTCKPTWASAARHEDHHNLQ